MSDILVTINGQRGMYSGFVARTGTHLFSMFNGSCERLANLQGVIFDKKEEREKTESIKAMEMDDAVLEYMLSHYEL